MRKVIGVMGSGRPLDPASEARARALGRLIAQAGYVLLTGGRASGVMDACSAGAKEAGGLVVGVLPDTDASTASRHLDVAIKTGMGDARNVINVLSSDAVIALPGGAGTLSEVAHALKAGKPVIVLGWDPGPALRAAGRVLDASTPEEALALAREVMPQ
ncbi:MAG: TIGR00725 family protein [Coriobacteriia bacterium]|nr:TIGR00725 family protein [Coriobacteriia bacterium]MDI6843295.1 TIGR00725 family protein [Anaerosomatales bacterium]